MNNAMSLVINDEGEVVSNKPKLLTIAISYAQCKAAIRLKMEQDLAEA